MQQSLPVCCDRRNIMQLQDRVAVITGAAGGIGAAVSRDLSAAGVSLVMHGRSTESLAPIRQQIAGPVELFAADIVDPDVPQALIDKAVEVYGRCDIVVNNAGILETGPLDEIDLDRVCRMVRVNVEAAFRLAYVACRHFQQARGGHLVNTSSVMGLKTRPTAGAYAGTKHAIEALSEGLRVELAGTSVAVSCVEPGLVTTGLHRNWETPPAEKLGISEPLQPEDIARAVRYILEQPDHVRIPQMLVMPRDHAM
jgi:NADP-dependent 3-hydroxy acid dehydrogenase YdfG